MSWGSHFWEKGCSIENSIIKTISQTTKLAVWEELFIHKNELWQSSKIKIIFLTQTVASDSLWFLRHLYYNSLMVLLKTHIYKDILFVSTQQKFLI